MSLPKISVIVAIDSQGGIAKDGAIPWQDAGDMKFFRETTTGHGKNAVIMGRLTYETIPVNFRPLAKRDNIVLSKGWRQEDHPRISVFHDMIDALLNIGTKKYDEIFVIGGETIYNLVLRDFMYLVKKIYVTRLKTAYNCDQTFPWEEVQELPMAHKPIKQRDYVRYTFCPSVYHYEHEYLKTLRYIHQNGENRPDRTGIGTKAYFGTRMVMDISERVPILTTKKLLYDQMIRELLFFVSGNTDTKVLEEQGVKYWKGNTSKEFIEKRGLDYSAGDMGPLYGFQWRHWGAEYEGCEKDYSGKGVDQLQKLIEGIQNEPFSRRHILSAWNASDLDKMVLPPCHLLAQFNVSADQEYLDCQLYQRSGDMFLGVPFNIAMYGILTYMIAQVCNLKPRKFVHLIGDSHIYNTHVSAVERQLGRDPHPWPRLVFRDAHKIKSIDDFSIENFDVQNYSSAPFIPAKMAV